MIIHLPLNKTRIMVLLFDRHIPAFLTLRDWVCQLHGFMLCCWVIMIKPSLVVGDHKAQKICIFHFLQKFKTYGLSFQFPRSSSRYLESIFTQAVFMLRSVVKNLLKHVFDHLQFTCYHSDAWMMKFSQESSVFHILTSCLDSQVVHGLPYTVFPLKTLCYSKM